MVLPEAPELLDIQPRELKFLFELKKQSSCTIQLVNKFDGYVAFKVKTTSPKKYCVRPNVGIINPKSFCDFIVVMQAPKVVPPDMVCKDKFLIQSTIVPAGTTDNDITSSMFTGDDNRHVEEAKLRVTLLSPPNSPILSPINTILKQDPVHEAPLLKDHLMQKLGSSTQKNHAAEDVAETKVNNSEVTVNNLKYNAVKEVEGIADHAEYESMKELEDPSKYVVYRTDKGAEGPAKNGDYKILDHLNHEDDPIKSGDNKILGHVKDQETPKKKEDHEALNHVKDELDPTKDMDYEALKRTEQLEQSMEDVNKTIKEAKEPTKDAAHRIMDDVDLSVQDLHHSTVKHMEETKLVKDVEEMKSKLNVLESKLTEAQVTISKLTEERRWTGQERESLRRELTLLRSKGGDRKVQVGFPFLFVCMVALVSVVLGYALRC